MRNTITARAECQENSGNSEVYFRKNPRRVSAVRRLDRRYPKGESVAPSRRIAHLKKLVQAHGPGLRVVLHARESYRNANLDKQVDALKADVTALGCEVLEVFTEQGAGWQPPENRYSLFRAIAIARKSGAVLVVRDTERLLRPLRFELTKSDDEPLTDLDFSRLLKMLGGIQVASTLAPDASPHEIRSARVRAGQKRSGNKSGRPLSKKKKRKRLKPEALKLFSAGMSQRAISKKLDTPRSTIRRWITD